MERWRKVNGMPGIEASDHGRIKRDGKLTAAKRIKVRRWSGGEFRHRLIAMAWLGLNAKDKRYVVKFRGGKSCRVSNLYVCRSADCHQRRPARGEAQGRAKLTTGEVREILALRGRMPQSGVARRFKVTPSTICDIWHRRTWRHVA